MKKKTEQTGNLNQSSLEKWHSEIISKNEKDYSLEDICRMLRQDYKFERAAQIGVEYLLKDPFIGYLYNGKLLSAFIFDQKSYIYAYRDDFDRISSSAHKKIINGYNFLDEDCDERKGEDVKHLIVRLDNMLNGNEANLHLELIPKTINKHFELVSIGTNLANPEYKWQRLPFLPIKFDEKNAKSNVKRLNNVLKNFKGNCKWFVHSANSALTVNNFR